MHPFQTFILGQKNIGPRIAAKYNIPLVFYGESEAEYGNPSKEFKPIRDSKYWLSSNKDYFLANSSIIGQLGFSLPGHFLTSHSKDNCKFC